MRTALTVRRNADLPTAMRTAIARLVLRVENMPANRLPNPISFLGFRIGYLGEAQFRYLLNEIFVEGCYRFNAATSSPVVIDCGSNIGMSILFFKALYPESRIIAFEPDPDAFRQLQENVAANRLAGVELHNIALCADDADDVDFFVSSEEKGALTMSTERERLPETRITVPGRRLSRYLLPQVDLLKMDIEGSEGPVMRELENSGALRHVDRIHLEYHHHIRPAEDRMSEILGLLERNGFGYQIQARSRKWPTSGQFQDIAIFAYNKNTARPSPLSSCNERRPAMSSA